MTRDQVRFVMGTPLVADIFHADRWDYVYTRVPERGGPLERRRVGVFFQDDKLVRLEGDVVPGAK
jgi:outer membrane protein assembly factor BamE